MKNIIKKISFLILLVLFLGINKVNARSCEDITLYANSGFIKNTGITMHYPNYYGNDSNYKYKYYILEDSGGADFTTYCRNAGLTTNKSYDGENFVCEQTVFDTSSTNESGKAYDAGILAILENGYSVRNNNGAYLGDSNQEIMATTIALRTYEMLWEDKNTNPACGSNPTWQLKSHMYYVNKYLNDNEIKILLKQAVGTVRSAYTCNVDVWNITQGANNITSIIEAEVKRLIKIGLNAAINYRNNGAASVSYSGPTSTILDTEYNEGIETYKKTVTYTFSLNNFKNANSKVNLTFSCPNCSTLGLNYKIYINNTDVGSATSHNLLSYVKSGTGKVTVKILFTRDTSLYNCNAIQYNLNLNYFDETIDTEAYEMKAGDCTPGIACQHFYMLYSTNNEVTETISDTIEVCDCNELEDLCEDGHKKACTIIDTDYEGKCANCKPIITNAKCTKDDSEIDILEGYELDDETCEKSPEENILQCVVESKDEAGNSYVSNDINSKYCTVWCKEDYHIKLPGQQDATNGRYFSLKTNIEGTKSCYTSLIDKNTFETDYSNAKSEIINTYNLYNSSKTSSNKNKLDAAIKKFDNIVEEYNSCSNWELNYNYDPDVKFWYEEGYMNNVHTNILETVGEVKKNNVNIQRCSSDVTDDAYKTCPTGWSSSPQMEVRNEYLCYKAGNGYTCGTKQVEVSKTIRMKASMKAGGSYITPTQFYTIYPSGSIAVADKNSEIENASPLENKLPIGLGTKGGVYNYTIFIDNLGEYYNSDKLGRIWGDSNSIVKITLADNKNICQEKGALVDKFGDNDEGVYVCAYKVNCPDCPVECDKDGCYWKDCPDNSCPVVCDNCVFSNDDANIDYRPISPDDINPNDRDLGKNWASDDSIDTAMELKAYTTTEEIETYGDTVYDIDYDSDDEEFAMEVTLDSKMIGKIKEYNDEHKDEGYLNNSLKCYDYKNSVDGETYKNVYCYSTFIDELLYDDDLKDNIKITKERVIGTNASESDDLRKTKTQDSGYWTTWSEAISSTWKITTERELYFKTKYGTNINIGPSWK